MKYNKNFYQIKPNTEIFKRIKAEREHIGYYNLPYQDTADIKSTLKALQKNILLF